MAGPCIPFDAQRGKPLARQPRPQRRRAGANERPRILVVDDDIGIRQMLQVYLSRKCYEVTTAIHGQDALDRIADARPHVVISDIQMPVMDGFELFRRLEGEYPYVKRILMTGYDIDSYIDMIRRHNIGNVLAKGDTFNIDDWGRYIDSILTGDVFGLSKLLPELQAQTHAVDSSAKAAEVCEKIVSKYQGRDRVFFEIALNELIRNAVYHGVLRLTNQSREAWQEEFELSPDQAVKVSWAWDDDRMGVAVEDPCGNLRKTDVLRWLDHPIEDTSTQENEHGRGLMLIRRIIDRFVVNISRGKRTECIIVQNYNRTKRAVQKSLMIHEV